MDIILCQSVLLRIFRLFNLFTNKGESIDMISAVLFRNYKNYNNMHFVQICNNFNEKYSVFVGNNGVGKSAILESIDVILNNRDWNYTKGAKKTESFICPIYLIEKNKLDDNNGILEIIGNYYWNVNERANSNIKNNVELQKLIRYRDLLKVNYEKTHYLIMIGGDFNNPNAAFCATFNDDILNKIMKHENITKEKAQQELDLVRKRIESLYRYLYIPVEESPSELLKLQNNTMQYLLNRNILEEIESLLKQNGRGKAAIVDRINQSLDEFIEEVNKVITQVDDKYTFRSEVGARKKITAKDIREKILEAYFPLKTLKVNGHAVENLSSGEQRKAIIDIAYSIIVANADKETEREIVLAIDEPESSMHISNCYSQFGRLDEIAVTYRKQVLITTHWYGFLPIIYKGNMHHITNDDGVTDICSFSLNNIMEERRSFPDVIELKSFFDLASSIITYIRTKPNDTWIICEGKDDKQYLECVLYGEKNINILPVGGCGNVSKLFEMIYSVMSEKTEQKVCKVLFLIDTDIKAKSYMQPKGWGNPNNNIKFRRLQVDNDVIKLYDPTKQNTYVQTEIEDCLDGNIYFEALVLAIKEKGDSDLKNKINGFTVKKDVQYSMLRGDDTILVATEGFSIEGKKKIIAFAESDIGKEVIVNNYKKIFDKLNDKPKHMLKDEILRLWD